MYTFQQATVGGSAVVTWCGIIGFHGSQAGEEASKRNGKPQAATNERRHGSRQ